MRLDKFAEIRAGLVLTRKKAEIEYEIEKEYKVINIKNIQTDGHFNEEPFEIFESSDELDKGYFTEEDDILIRLSYPHTAVYIDKSREGLLVPSYFVILKLTRQDFIPEYVVWYLNTDKARRELAKSHTGTTMSVTSKKMISSLDIKSMPLDKQKVVVEIQKLYWQEKHLLNRLIEEKEKYYKGITDKIIELE